MLAIRQKRNYTIFCFNMSLKRSDATADMRILCIIIKNAEISSKLQKPIYFESNLSDSLSISASSVI